MFCFYGQIPAGSCCLMSNVNQFNMEGGGLGQNLTMKSGLKRFQKQHSYSAWISQKVHLRTSRNRYTKGLDYNGSIVSLLCFYLFYTAHSIRPLPVDQ